MRVQGLAEGPPGRTPWWVTLFLFGVAAFWAIALMGSGHVGMDEAQQLAQAWRLTQGGTLYQSVWEFAAPLPLVAMSWLFAFTGPSLDVARGVAAALALLSVVASYRLSRLLGAPPFWASLASAGIAWGATPLALLWYHHGWSQALMLAAFVALAEALRRPQAAPWAAGAGLLAGLATLCTQSLLPVLLGAWGVAALLARWEGRWRTVGLEPWLLLSGLCLPWALATLAFALQGGALAFWSQVWWWPWLHYVGEASGNLVRPFTDVAELLFPFGREAMPHSVWLGRVVAWVGFALVGPVACALWLGGLAMGGGKAEAGQAPLRAALGVALCLQLAVVLRGRADLAHFQMSSPLACVFLAAWVGPCWVAAAAWAGAPEGRLALRLPAMLWLVLVLLAGGSSLWSLRQLQQKGLWAPGALDGLQRQEPALKALRQHVPQGGRLFAFPVWGQAYLFGGVQPATRFMLLTRQDYHYHGPEEYAAFRADWAASPPDAVAILDVPASLGVAQWGGQPDLSGYQQVYQGPWRMGSTLVPLSLWTRQRGRP